MPPFRPGQRVRYRPSSRRRDNNDFVFAIVRKITERRVTIEFELNGERVLRVVLADRLTAI